MRWPWASPACHVSLCDAAVRSAGEDAAVLSRIACLRKVGRNGRAAAEERRRLRDWVAEYEDGFVISAMWFRYQQLGTRGLFGAWLDVIERISM